MGVETSKPLSAFGFLTVVEDQEHGFFGGYLVLTETGRPLEFHCSTPIRANQAQKILYGASLRPYLLGELIGQALFRKAQIPVQALLSDQEESLSLALLLEVPVLCAEEISQDLPLASQEKLVHFPQIVAGKYRVRGTTTCNWQPEELADQLQGLMAHVDLMEPFDRIRGAIGEAQRVSDRSGEKNHDSTAA